MGQSSMRRVLWVCRAVRAHTAADCRALCLPLCLSKSKKCFSTYSACRDALRRYFFVLRGFMFLGSSMYAIRHSTHFLNSNGRACPQISHTAEHAQIPFSGQLLHLLPVAGKKLMCVFSEGMNLAMNLFLLYQAWLIAKSSDPQTPLHCRLNTHATTQACSVHKMRKLLLAS